MVGFADCSIDAHVIRDDGDHADFQAREKELRAKVTSAMMYPAVLLFLAIAVLVFLLVFFIPRFKGIFAGFGAQLPLLTRIIVGSIGVARDSIAIMTPYFLPARELDLALQLAAMRGVRVQVILPDKSNMPFVNWAAFHMLSEMLGAGVEFYLYTGPFVHSKLLVVDDYYVQIGSANLDPRSLRLNFEVNVEIYDERIAQSLADYFACALALSQPLTAMQIARRPPLSRFAGGVFWLMSPFL